MVPIIIPQLVSLLFSCTVFHCHLPGDTPCPQEVLHTWKGGQRLGNRLGRMLTGGFECWEDQNKERCPHSLTEVSGRPVGRVTSTEWNDTHGHRIGGKDFEAMESWHGWVWAWCAQGPGGRACGMWMERGGCWKKTGRKRSGAKVGRGRHWKVWDRR